MANSCGRFTRSTLLVAAIFFALAEAALASPSPSRLAYVDPGAGSFILQAAVAMFAGAVVALNTYWARIKGYFSRDTSRDEEPATPSDDA